MPPIRRDQPGAVVLAQSLATLAAMRDLAIELDAAIAGMTRRCEHLAATIAADLDRDSTA